MCLEKKRCSPELVAFRKSAWNRGPTSGRDQNEQVLVIEIQGTMRQRKHALRRRRQKKEEEK